MRRITFEAARAVTILTVLSFAASSCNDDASGLIVAEGKLELDPPTLDFGKVQIGTQTEGRIVLKNTGEGVLGLADIVMPAAGPFTFDCGESPCAELLVPASGSAFLNIRYAPTALGMHMNQVIVQPDAEALQPATLILSGEGVTAVLDIDPGALDFGSVVVDTSRTLPITVTNTADIDADVHYVAGANVSFCGDPDRTGAYCVAPTNRPFSADARLTLGPGESTRLSIQFSPTLSGARERGNFSLKACASCEPVEIALDGLGIDTGFGCMPATLDFGPVNPGACITRIVTCENIANEVVTVVDWGPPSTTAISADFSFEPFTTVASLDQGDSIDIDVTFCPDAIGSDEGILEVETDNTDANQRVVSVRLTGTGGGPDIEVLPPVVDFGDVSLVAPSRRTVLITNVGFGELEVARLVITSSTGPFSARTSGAIIPVRGSDSVTVEFRPTATGPAQAELLIESNDQDEPLVRVLLRGVGVPLPPCAFEVVPDRLPFGVVERGRVASRAFEVRNSGQAECLLTGARILARTDQEFSLPDGNIRSVRVAPGAAEAIRVEYAPTTTEDHTGIAEFAISSDTRPFNEVVLTGSGVDATLLVVPQDVDFGAISVGCAARARTVTIYNTGNAAATIDSIDIAAPANPAFSITRLPAPLPAQPLVLPPGASTSFDVGFRTDRVSAYASGVRLMTNFAGANLTQFVSLLGRGDINAVQSDEFDQLGKPAVDMLIIVDDSCSMSQEQAALAANFETFIQFAQAQELDYQIAVTTTDIGGMGPGGRFVPLMGGTQDRIVRPVSQPSPQALFNRNVSVGTEGSGNEQGLHAAFLALSNPLIFGHNSGFLRPDAVLSLIFVSDEPDHSSSSLDFYVNFFLSIKGFRNTNLFSASAIVGDLPGGCTGAGGTAMSGPRYIDVANRTGGIFQSICTGDWSRSLEDLSTTAFGFKSRFFLSNQPVLTSIMVLVDGAGVPAAEADGTLNWEYDVDTNSVNFSPFSTPEPGAHIRVEYTVECL